MFNYIESDTLTGSKCKCFSYNVWYANEIAGLKWVTNRFAACDSKCNKYSIDYAISNEQSSRVCQSFSITDNFTTLNKKLHINAHCDNVKKLCIYDLGNCYDVCLWYKNKIQLST